MVKTKAGYATLPYLQLLPCHRRYAPFYSGGGYCSEAIEFALALEKEGVRIRIEQHGDSFNPDFVKGLPPSTQEGLFRLSGRVLKPNRNTVAVCHSGLFSEH